MKKKTKTHLILISNTGGNDKCSPSIPAVAGPVFDIEAHGIEISLSFPDGDREKFIEWIADGRPLSPPMRNFLVSLLRGEAQGGHPRLQAQWEREMRVLGDLTFLRTIGAYGHSISDTDLKSLTAAGALVRIRNAIANPKPRLRTWKGNAEAQILKVHGIKDARTLAEYKKKHGFKF